MKRPSQYHLSQASLEYFANTFNSLPVSPNIRWEYIRDETFKNDGFFIDIATGKTFGFDWEIRRDYFQNGIFTLTTLGQFERKLTEAKNISLSIQCDKECTAIIVAWHEDWMNEDKVLLPLKNDTDTKDEEYVRYTPHFRVYKYSEMEKFKTFVCKALQCGQYNHTVFDDEIAIANRNSQLYHRPFAECALINENNRIVFENAQIASANGYKPCYRCHDMHKKEL